jgi:polyisoprenoid-binding protein YceI
MHTVHGTFHLTRGRIDFDSETGRASGEVIVDTTSGKTGNDSRDANMHKTVLESQQFPQAIFVPDRVEGKVLVSGSSSVKVHGMLTVHGAAREMTMDVQTSASADRQMKATMSFEIPFVAWGMKDPSTFMLKVGKMVKMTIDASGIITLK